MDPGHIDLLREQSLDSLGFHKLSIEPHPIFISPGFPCSNLYFFASLQIQSSFVFIYFVDYGMMPKSGLHIP